ncbi:serine hydrolase domain-containing protein [Amycolatopsis anabasis]|uniref:serine hydrolase domain-containing protein n=1 Tax=Amycolatopsis anabasis TaxID=1840409 RepID=UPI00131DE9C6|nr:serine hydrolase domain-containing protein [Amycolatopsis anabasis]
MRGCRKVVAGVAMAGLLGTIAAPAAAAGEQDPLGGALDRLVQAGFPGGLAYLRAGERVRYATAGVAELRTGEPVRPGQRFRIASNTKAFVATVLLQLVGEGELSLADSVERWLPGTVRGEGYDASKITVRQLLNHTSGIHDPRDPHFFDPYLKDENWGYVYTPDEVIRQSLLDPPDDKPGYTNTGYLLLGKIIERVTGNDVRDEISARILRPLGLKDTYFPLTDPHIRGPHLHGYDFGLRDMSVFSPSYDWTAGAMVSTVDDLAAFHRALFEGDLLEPEQQRLLKELAPGGHYALGVERGSVDCPSGERTIWGNTGGGPGYTSMSFTTEDGSRQLVFVLTQFDLAADQAGRLPWQAVPTPLLEAGLCS